jgi:hypothetical protein
MHLYEDVSFKDAMTFAEGIRNWMSLQWREHGLEDPLLPLVAKKCFAFYMPQRYDPSHHR